MFQFVQRKLRPVSASRQPPLPKPLATAEKKEKIKNGLTDTLTGAGNLIC